MLSKLIHHNVIDHFSTGGWKTSLNTPPVLKKSCQWNNETKKTKSVDKIKNDDKSCRTSYLIDRSFLKIRFDNYIENRLLYRCITLHFDKDCHHSAMLLLTFFTEILNYTQTKLTSSVSNYKQKLKFSNSGSYLSCKTSHVLTWLTHLSFPRVGTFANISVD